MYCNGCMLLYAYVTLTWTCTCILFQKTLSTVSDEVSRRVYTVHVLSFSVSRRDSRFLSRSALSSRRARNSENATKGLCAALVCHHAKFRAQTCIARWGVVFRARVLAHTLLCVFLFVTSTTTTVVLPYEGKLFMCTAVHVHVLYTYSTFFCWLFPNYNT